MTELNKCIHQKTLAQEMQMIWKIFKKKNWFCLNNQQQIMLHTIAESLECYSESDTVTAVNVIDAHQMNCVHTQKK